MVFGRSGGRRKLLPLRSAAWREATQTEHRQSLMRGAAFVSRRACALPEAASSCAAASAIGLRDWRFRQHAAVQTAVPACRMSRSPRRRRFACAAASWSQPQTAQRQRFTSEGYLRSPRSVERLKRPPTSLAMPRTTGRPLRLIQKNGAMEPRVLWPLRQRQSREVRTRRIRVRWVQVPSLTAFLNAVLRDCRVDLPVCVVSHPWRIGGSFLRRPARSALGPTGDDHMGDCGR